MKAVQSCPSASAVSTAFGKFGLRAEYEVIEDFTMLSVGGVFKF
jgi:hypothetical protein